MEKEIITTEELIQRISNVLQECDNDFIQNLATQLLAQEYLYMGDDFYEIQ